MEEIVVALRETRRDAARPIPFPLVGGHARGNWTADAIASNGTRAMAHGLGATANAHNGVSSTSIADLRDGEIERLLTENARLNERIVFLLKVIEQEQTANISVPEPAATEADRAALVHDIKAALDAELRPVLLVLLRLLEKQRADPTENNAGKAKPTVPHRPIPVDIPPDWITELGRKLDTNAAAPGQQNAPAMDARPSRPTLRQRFVHAFRALHA